MKILSGMTYIEVYFTKPSQQLKEILIALLSDAQYEGFEEDDNTLKAYIVKSLFDEELLARLSEQYNLQYSITELPETNWNKLWESNFEPVTVDDFCAIRADFHEPAMNVKHEIVITPKMSFGTGHHATTFMMIRQMEQIDLANKTVLDFGTGTGVLAILAEKLGAVRVVAIDNDDWSIANAEENFGKNSTKVIELRKSDTADLDDAFDVILANITRNVILDNFSFFVSLLTEGGTLLLSGLLQDDEETIVTKAVESRLTLIKKLQRDNWISLKFKSRSF